VFPIDLRRIKLPAVKLDSRRLAGILSTLNGFRRRLQMPPLKIRTQIILPFLLLVLIFGVLGTYLTTSLVADSLEHRIAEQLVHSQDTALDAAVKFQGRQLSALRTLANTEGMEAAVLTRDTRALRQLLEPIEINSRLGSISVFDTQGRVLLQVDQPDPRNPAGLVFSSGADLSTLAVVAPILRGSYDALGDKYVGYLGNPPAQLAAAGPILSGDRVIGGVMIANPLQTVLQELQSRSSADVILLDRTGRLIGSTLPGVSARPLDDKSRSYLDLASPGRASHKSQSVAGEVYELQFTHFFLRQRPEGYLGVALSRHAVIDAGLRSAVQMTTLFAGVVLVLLLIGYVLALRLTRPIEELVAGTQAVARGDLARRLTVRRRDELGNLATAFNSMTGDLQERTRALNAQMRRLAALYQTSQGLGRQSAAGEMAEAILGVSLKSLGIDKAILISRNQETQGAELRAAVGVPADSAHLLGRLNGSEMVEGFQTGSHAVETVQTPNEDPRLCIRLFSRIARLDQVVVVPLIRDDQNAGYLLVGQLMGQALPQEDIELLKTIATEMALMLENADLRKKAELQAHRLDQAIIALEKISQALTAVTVGTDNLLRAVAHATTEILEVPYASIHLRKESWRGQFWDVMVGASSRRELAAVRASGELVVKRIDRPEQVLEVDLAEGGVPVAAHRMGLRRAIGVPMCFGTEIVGVLVIHMRVPRKLERSEIRVLQTLANQAVIALENASVYERTKQLATTDALTGVANHREFETRLDRELQRAKKSQSPVSVIICDVDNFKEINDTVGHPAGDAVLRYLTQQVLVPALRPKDMVARYGGDEFVMILPGADIRAAVAIAERVRRVTAERPFIHEGRVISKISLSLGISVFPRDGETREALVQAADQALYVAKRGGRNRVVRSDSGLTQDAKLAS
jgi:diguanylate cyclase (GGDEF)-like protein